MHKYDEFVHKEISPRLSPGEGIEVTGFLFTKSLTMSVVSHGLSLIGDGYFFAALTRKRMFLIATEMGIASLKMMNKKLVEIPYTEIRSIKHGGFLNQKTLTVELNNGQILNLRLNSLAMHYASGQKNFIPLLMEFYQNQ